MASSPFSTAADAHKRQSEPKRKWFTQINHSLLVLLGCNTGSLSLQLHSKKAPADNHIWLKAEAPLAFYVKKTVTDWHKLFPLFFLVGSRRGYWHSLNRCHLWRKRVIASAGPLYPGAKLHHPHRVKGGTVSTSERFTSLLFALLFLSLQLSSKNICLLFLRRPTPLTSVLASPWPVHWIVVDVMTKNKQWGSERTLCVSRAFSLAADARKDIPQRTRQLPPLAHSPWQVQPEHLVWIRSRRWIETHHLLPGARFDHAVIFTATTIWVTFSKKCSVVLGKQRLRRRGWALSRLIHECNLNSKAYEVSR